MPAHPPRTHPVVDAPLNPRTDKFHQGDVQPKFTQDASADPTTPGAATSRDASSGYRALVEEGRRKPTPLASSLPKRGISSLPDDDVHIPPATDAGAGARVIETSIWDWNPPVESFTEDLTNDYELQGELLTRESREHLPARTEFNVPGGVALSPGSGHWPFPASAVGSLSATLNEGFVVPPRRSESFTTSAAGNKRKSRSERGPGGTSGDTKRSSRGIAMADSTSEPPSSPSSSSAAPSTVATQVPSQNTRSQATTSSTRLRSVTDTTDLRARLSLPEIESQARAGAAAGVAATGKAPRRATTDTVAALSLPTRKVFPIQIGDKLFRLSGASISSDG